MSGWPKGGTRRWRKTRNVVLAANPDGRCKVGVAGVCTVWARTVHHTHGRAVTGDDPTFLVPSCRPCNQHIGDPQKHPAACPRCVEVRIGPRAGDPAPRPMTRW